MILECLERERERESQVDGERQNESAACAFFCRVIFFRDAKVANATNNSLNQKAHHVLAK